MADLRSPITNQSEAFKAIRKECLDVFNRLHSIDEDASFVSSIAHAYSSFPVVGMVRRCHVICGTDNKYCYTSQSTMWCLVHGC